MVNLEHERKGVEEKKSPRVKFLDPEIMARMTDEAKMFWEISMLEFVMNDVKDWTRSVVDFLRRFEKKIAS